MTTQTNSSYIYVLIAREFLNSGQPVYKIGKTNQNPPWKRILQYPNGSEVFLLRKVNDCSQMESLIKQKLKETTSLKQKIDIGDEYFEGNINEIIKICNDLCQNENLIQPKSNIATNTNMSANDEKDTYKQFIDDYVKKNKRSGSFGFDSDKIYMETKYWCNNIGHVKCPLKIDIHKYVENINIGIQNELFGEFIQDCLLRDDNNEIRLEETYGYFKSWWQRNYGGRYPTRKVLIQGLNTKLGKDPNNTKWGGYKLISPDALNQILTDWSR
jgi:hypothetical protein